MSKDTEWVRMEDEEIESEFSDRLKAHELEAALGTMLRAWHEASDKLTEFLQHPTKANAEAYSKFMPALFEAATIGRVVYYKHRRVNNG